jgi:hypothetical protein
MKNPRFLEFLENSFFQDPFWGAPIDHFIRDPVSKCPRAVRGSFLPHLRIRTSWPRNRAFFDRVFFFVFFFGPSGPNVHLKSRKCPFPENTFSKRPFQNSKWGWIAKHGLSSRRDLQNEHICRKHVFFHEFLKKPFWTRFLGPRPYFELEITYVHYYTGQILDQILDQTDDRTDQGLKVQNFGQAPRERNCPSRRSPTSDIIIRRELATNLPVYV